MSLIRACGLLTLDFDKIDVLAQNNEDEDCEACHADEYEESESDLDGEHEVDESLSVFKSQYVKTRSILEMNRVSDLRDIAKTLRIDCYKKRKDYLIDELVRSCEGKAVDAETFHEVDWSTVVELRKKARDIGVGIPAGSTKINIQILILERLCGEEDTSTASDEDDDEWSVLETESEDTHASGSVRAEWCTDDDGAETVDSVPCHVGDTELSRVLNVDIIKQLGAGGFGAAYKCHDRTLRRDVVVKVLHRTGGRSAETVIREAQLAAKVNCPHIVTIYRVCDRPPAIVMEYCRGGSLLDKLEVAGDGLPMPVLSILRLWYHVSKALYYLEKSKILHLDLGPHNILLQIEDDEVFKVCDFGIGMDRLRNLGPSAECAHPIWYAPERYLCLGEALTPAYDVFTLGKTIAACIVGYEEICKFSKKNSYEEMIGRVEEEAPRYIGKNMTGILTSMLSLNPEDRLRPEGILRTVERYVRI